MTTWRSGSSTGWPNPACIGALVDLKNWTLLKWLDDPAPFFDWRASMTGDHAVAPRRRRQMAKMAAEFATGSASGVLRMRANGGGWTPVHVTVNRVELDEDVYAGLATLRIPTDERDRRRRARGHRRRQRPEAKGQAPQDRAAKS